MSKPFVLGAALLFSVSIFMTVGARSVAAQGPAGAGAAAVAAQDSPHSMNPMKWLRKGSDNSAVPAGDRLDAEKKLTPILQAHGLLDANTTATQACAPFEAVEDCLAVLHASHNLGVNFYCLRAVVSGVHTSVNLSGCRAVDGDKPRNLSKGIHLSKPNVNAKRAAKDAEEQAADDLKAIGG